MSKNKNKKPQTSDCTSCTNCRDCKSSGSDCLDQASLSHKSAEDCAH